MTTATTEKPKPKKPALIDCIGFPIKPGMRLKLKVASRATTYVANSVNANSGSALHVGSIVTVISVTNIGNTYGSIGGGNEPIRQILVKCSNGQNFNIYDNCAIPLELNKETIARRVAKMETDLSILKELQDVYLDSEFSIEDISILKTSYIVKKLKDLKDAPSEQVVTTLESLMDSDFAEVLYAE